MTSSAMRSSSPVVTPGCTARVVASRAPATSRLATRIFSSSARDLRLMTCCRSVSMVSAVSAVSARAGAGSAAGLGLRLGLLAGQPGLHRLFGGGDQGRGHGGGRAVAVDVGQDALLVV